MLFKVTDYLTVAQHSSFIDNKLFVAGNNLIVETETPIKTEDMNPSSNGGDQQLGNNDQLSILPHHSSTYIYTSHCIFHHPGN